MMIKNEKLNAIAAKAADDLLDLVAESETKILEAWDAATDDAQENETAPKFKLGLALYDAGKWQDLDETYATITMKGYTRYDAFVEWRAVQNITIFAKCENLENKLYQPIYSFPVPGRIYTVGLKATAEF